MPATTSNEKLRRWVADWAEILQPDSIHWCDGSAEEYDQLAQELVDSGELTAEQARDYGLVDAVGRDRELHAPTPPDRIP